MGLFVYSVSFLCSGDKWNDILTVETITETVPKCWIAEYKCTHLIYQLKARFARPYAWHQCVCYSPCWRTSVFCPSTEWNIQQGSTLAHANSQTHTEVVMHRQVLAFGGQQADVSIPPVVRVSGVVIAMLSTHSRLWRHLNHFNGFIIWSLRHTRKDYCDCICPAPVISVCVWWHHRVTEVCDWRSHCKILANLQKHNCSLETEKTLFVK